MSPFSGKRVLILGLARQGLALARFFLQQGADVTISDLAPADQLAEPLAALAGQPVRLILGGHPPELLASCDLLCLSGGVPPQIPIVAAARRQGVALSNDAILTMQYSPAPVTGITGSSGKTTTTTLVGLMLNGEDETTNDESGTMPPPSSFIIPPSSFIIPPSSFHVWVGGNIGVPLVDQLDHIQPEDKVVLELSSFQLELFNPDNGGVACGPAIAGLLNITPNHLDRHPSMAHYAAAKSNLLRWQRADGVAVLGADDAVTGAWLRSGRVEISAGEGQPAVDFELPARRLGFGLGEPMGDGCWLNPAGDTLVLRLDGREEPVLPVRHVQLRGRHNLLNVAAACTLAAAAGASTPALAEAAARFRGVPHRLEVVRERNGVRWINDSIATTPERAAAALRSFDEPIIWLAGGRDKHLPWEEVTRLAIERARAVIAFGEAEELITQALRLQHPEFLTIASCATLSQAVLVAAGLAQPGDVVLLSPGGTSFDAYKDFAARGEHFRTLVNGL